VVDALPRDPAALLRDLRQLLSVNFGIDIPPGGTLLEHGMAIDSVGLVQLIALVEEHFQIRFEEDELRIDSFNDLNRLADLVSSALARSNRPRPE
jgi:acyl carrier protein